MRLTLDIWRQKNGADAGRFETYSVEGVSEAIESGSKIATVKADGKTFQAKVRIDTPREVDYFRSGGILQYVLRHLAA